MISAAQGGELGTVLAGIGSLIVAMVGAAAGWQKIREAHRKKLHEEQASETKEKSVAFVELERVIPGMTQVIEVLQEQIDRSVRDFARLTGIIDSLEEKRRTDSSEIRRLHRELDTAQSRLVQLESGNSHDHL